MDGIMGISFPWARNSIVRWLVSGEPQTIAWVIERLAEKYGVRLRFFLRRYSGYEFACLLFESVGEGSEEYRAVSRSPWGGSQDWFVGSVRLRW